MENKGVTTKECYDFYRRNRRCNNIQIKRHIQYKTVVNAIFAKIYEVMMLSQGGVNIEGFGYFCRVRKVREKEVIVEKENSLFKKKELKKSYITHFEPDGQLKDWTMNGTFTRPIGGLDIDYKLNFGICKIGKRRRINNLKK
jgi:hypothetical protein